MTQKEFSQYWDKRTTQESFQKNIPLLVRAFWNTLADYPIRDITSFARGQFDTYYKDGFIHERRENWEKVSPLIMEIFLSFIRKEEKSFRERISDQTWEKWKEYSKKTIDIPPEFIQNIMKQPAIKELFTDVIHKAIIAFSKKINPFFNAVSGLGVEKQIRDFIIPFMDNVVEIATNFILSQENRNMFEDLNAVLLENLAGLKPQIIAEVDLSQWTEELGPLLEKTMTDEIFKASSRETFHSFLNSVEEAVGDKTLRDLLRNGDKDVFKDMENLVLAKEEIQILTAYLRNPSVGEFMLKEFMEYEKKR